MDQNTKFHFYDEKAGSCGWMTLDELRALLAAPAAQPAPAQSPAPPAKGK